MALASLVVALGLVVGVAGALVVAVVLLACGSAAGVIAYRTFPRHVLAATGRRLEDDEAILKEHLT